MKQCFDGHLTSYITRILLFPDSILGRRLKGETSLRWLIQKSLPSIAPDFWDRLASYLCSMFSWSLPKSRWFVRKNQICLFKKNAVCKTAINAMRYPSSKVRFSSNYIAGDHKVSDNRSGYDNLLSPCYWFSPCSLGPIHQCLVVLESWNHFRKCRILYWIKLHFEE